MGMFVDRFMFAAGEDDLRFYEERAGQEKAASEAASTPEAASAHRLLAIQYEAHAHELREQLTAKQGHEATVRRF
ncbi:MAG: hypothetical protein QHC67_12885 [Sphingobium sp.]|uniref:hypothetical protein n=1 Tax=Sphingobium sp. TaxID=1912891 RepID=UPI0029AE70E7|nr:hypothetical protein [Sphingobium sp.]MDX3910695.1 hypothetical protein [Sphingobium sp.]